MEDCLCDSHNYREEFIAGFMEEWLKESVYIIENTPKLYFDYMSFKKFAAKENYQVIISRIVERVERLLSQHNTFEIHVNLFSFSTASLAKYADFLRIFVDYSSVFGDKLTDLYIYYTPSIMDSVFKIVSRHISNKNKNTAIPNVVMYTKNDSADYLRMLFL
jgi:hypothetical protein